jgi:hypothetical protein
MSSCELHRNKGAWNAEEPRVQRVPVSAVKIDESYPTLAKLAARSRWLDF